MIQYARERFSDTIAEIRELLPRHYAEVKLRPDVVKLNLDEASYHHLEEQNSLVLVTGRYHGRLIGYHISFLKFDHHSSHSLIAATDGYYLLPEYRRGWNGIRLFRAAERILKELGVVKVYTGATLHMETAKMFRWSKYIEEEIIFSKLL